MNELIAIPEELIIRLKDFLNVLSLGLESLTDEDLEAFGFNIPLVVELSELCEELNNV